MDSILKKADAYSQIIHFGEENDGAMDKICAALLALTPILQHYKGVFYNAGITALLLALPWAAFRLLGKVIRYRPFKLSQAKAIFTDRYNIIIGLVLFIIYRTFAHGLTFELLAYNVVMAGCFIAAAFGNINIKYYIKVSACIAALACGIIILQYFCYYVLKFHLQAVPTSLLLPEAGQWVLGARTGLAGITGRIGKLYRPSAFFLEPSHMFLYTFPHLFMALFAPDADKKRIGAAVLFTVGLVFTTSGMGIVAAVSAWGIYLTLYYKKGHGLAMKKPHGLKKIIIPLSMSLIVAVLIIFVPFVRGSVMRFLDMSKKGAIAGRTRLAKDLIVTLRDSDLIFGVANDLSGIEFNMPGFAATLYKFGVVGVILSYSLYVIGAIRLRRQYFWISLTVLGVSFFSAHTHGTFYMIYYVFFLLEGNYSSITQKKQGQYE